MKNMQKIILMSLLFLLPQLSCNSESKKQQSHNNDGVQQIAANSASSAADNTNSSSATSVRVFNMSDVKSMGANKASDFTWTENGKTYKFSEYTKGKVVFLNFWGTWCPPCRAEIPDIIEVSKELKNKDFIVIGMATERSNEKDPLTKVADFAKEKGIPYTIFVSNDAIRKNYGGIQFVPTTFIIDKDGNIVETINGMKDKAGFLSSINKVLK